MGSGERERLADVAAELARERWGDSFQRPARAPATGSVPDLDVVAAKTAAVFDLAETELQGRTSTRIQAWEDGEFEVRVRHDYGPYGDAHRLRAALRYHSATGDVEGAVLEADDAGQVQAVLHREQIANIGAVATSDGG